MSLKRLAVSNFRNLQQVDINLEAGVNLFSGDNGSGKTSLLEAVHMLAFGRSFRSRQHQSVIREGVESLAVFGQLAKGDTLGVQRQRAGGGRVRLNQHNVESSSQLAALLPLQVINADSFSALDGGPGVRRRLLDWTVFHVEHQFLSCWKGYEIALKQRNALLRRGKIDPESFDIWEQRLAQSGEQVDVLRRSVFAPLREHFLRHLEELDDALLCRVDLNYRSGWKKDTELLAALSGARESDLAQGHTRLGPHRGDLRFTVGSDAAQHILSRGQQKMVVCALRVAMAELVSAGQSEAPVFLIDDLPAELDTNNQQRFAHWVSRCASQVLVTGIDENALALPWRTLGEPWNQPKMFHVEHGTVTPASALD